MFPITRSPLLFRYCARRAALVTCTLILVLAADRPAPAQTSIWSATLTVGMYEAGPDTVFLGYGTPIPTSGSMAGQLDDISFEFDGTTYEVVQLLTVDQTIGRKLQLTVDPSLQGEDLTLRVGDGTFPLDSDSTINNHTVFEWTTPRVDWSAGETVSVGITSGSTDTGDGSTDTGDGSTDTGDGSTDANDGPVATASCEPL